MALLHVVDPATEDKADKLRKVESFINYFKSRCLALYQPRQNLAVDERMVKSRQGLVYNSISKISPPNGESNSGCWQTALMVTL